MGPWFGRGKWFGPWFDSAQDRSVFSGYGPPGSATFVLNPEAGFRVRYQWVTDIIKRYGGTEQRISVNDAPKQFYSGSAILTGSQPRRTRGIWARYSHIGSTYLLALPHEEISLVASSSNYTVYASATAVGLSDWAKVGQRVVVVAPDETTMSAVIQSVSGGSIELDVAPGTIGRAGGRLMPAMAMLLDPQQGLSRHPYDAEEWGFRARAAIFDFAPTLASIALGPVTSSVGLDGAVVYSRTFGLQGNQTIFVLDGDPGHPADGQLIDLVGTLFTIFRFKPGTTTVANFRDALLLSTYVKLGGTYDPAAILQAGDEMSGTLSGGSGDGDVGTGATLTTFGDRPVWDRPIQLDETAGDSLQSMTEIIDHGGKPYSIGSADFSDWGRHIMLERTAQAEWQWFKLFLSTVRGRQKAFWLPSYRDDLTYVGAGVGLGEILVATDDDSDLFAWWPSQRDHLHVEQEDGTITRCRINTAVDNGDGTATLELRDNDNDPFTFSGSPVSRMSWLELCRFESDDFDVVWRGATFSVQTVARVIRQ